MCGIERSSFRARGPFTVEQLKVVAVSCSDGRFGNQVDDFVLNGRGESCYDRVILPGGPARVLDDSCAADDLRFLIEAHELVRVVLIQHQGCAFYATKLGLDAVEAERQQAADLAAAARLIRGATAVEQVEGYFARVMNGAVEFERVSVE